MNQLVYSRKLSPQQQPGLLKLLKEAFNATPFALFVAALRDGR